MKKVAILTINDYNNYGNRLQNYALQEVLKSLNVSPVTLVNNTNYYTFKNKLSNVFEYSWREISEKIKDKFQQEKEDSESELVRRERFLEFTRAFIAEADFTLSEKNLPFDRLEEFDYFVTGSDQVWNPNFRYGSFVDFLTFAPAEKRIAYAPSFGVDEVPRKFHKNYRKWLSEMASLSVREQAGAEIIERLTGREALVLADPTLLLTKEEWLAVSKRAANRPKTPYLLTYFLGGPSEAAEKAIHRLAEEKQLQVINLGDQKDLETFKTGPGEFIDYICHASAFFTDSFHGVVFSILFEIPFLVFKRHSAAPSMYSRIETLLEKFALKDREATAFTGDVFSMDFSHTPDILNEEYEKSIDFLKEALRIEG